MQKYTGKYWCVLAPLVKKSLKKHYGKSFAAGTMKKAKTEYRGMLNSFARREGLLEVLTVICDMDFLTAGLMHAKLHRENTLTDGGKICDYCHDKLINLSR